MPYSTIDRSYHNMTDCICVLEMVSAYDRWFLRTQMGPSRCRWSLHVIDGLSILEMASAYDAAIIHYSLILPWFAFGPLNKQCTWKFPTIVQPRLSLQFSNTWNSFDELQLPRLWEFFDIGNISSCTHWIIRVIPVSNPIGFQTRAVREKKTL